ncbi:MAG: transcription elongation factor GreA [Omnitrophica bacterium GWA2_50_21]|nr:MAG: transcription elongation factor GreA [Omnitrophica bacterium GWA2_50_21]
MAVRLTKEGYEKLKEELKYLKTVKRQEVIKAISEARAHGDLRENAEYDSAKQAQHNLETRILELQIKLADVSIIDEASMDKNTVYLGATVLLQDVERNREVKYMLVSKEEADLKSGKISSDSPVGRQLLGKKVGDIAEIVIPAGTTRYKVLKIERG